MKSVRLVVLSVIALALVGLASAWSGTSTPTSASLDRAPLPAVRSDGDVGSTWYCAAGTSVPAASHSLILSNPTAHAVTARLTGYTTAGASAPTSVEVPPNGPFAVDVGATFGDPTSSVLVESPSPVLAVDHQLTTGDGGDRDTCQSTTSDTWSFPALSTTVDAAVRLSLFNPFPGDAGVDIAIGLDTGTRVPSALTGVVVPAGTTKVIDLGQASSRREQFTATVRSRSGRVVAEVVQTFDGSKGPRGLRMATGVPAARERWAFAGGFTGSGAAERLVVQNPGTTPIHALVQVTPYGAAKNPPEPLQIDVGPRRYVVVDLSAETRIPGVGYHSIQVEADHPVVVARTISLSGPPEPVTDPSIVGRPALDHGVAISTGTPVTATRWIIPAIDAGADPMPVLLVHNPGSGIAVIDATASSGGASTPIPDVTKVEVAPGDSVAIPMGVIGSPSAEATIVLGSTEPVVVERLVTYPAQVDLSFRVAAPVHDAAHPLRALGG